MIFRLKTSKRTQEIFEELENRTNYKPYTLVKHTTVDSSKRIPGIVSLVVEKSNFHNERFIKKISDEVALSTGSACSAGEPSYVIQALGLADKVTKVLRVSINKYTTEKDIEEFIKLLKTES